MSATKAKKATAPNKIHVYWKPDEYAKVGAWLVAHGFTDLSRRGILAAIEQAQKAVLPVERHRSVTATTVFKPLIPAMQEAVAAQEALKAEAQRKAAQEAEERRAAEEAEKQAAEEAKARQLMQEAQDALVPQHPIDAMLQGLAREMAQRFAHYMRIELQTAMSRELSAAVSSTIPGGSNAPTLAPRQRVLVVGLKPNQAGMISQEFQDIDLRFVESGTTPQAIKGKTNGVDTVIGITDFMGHDQEDVMKSHPGYVRVSGGMTKLRSVLTAMRSRLAGN